MRPVTRFQTFRLAAFACGLLVMGVSAASAAILYVGPARDYQTPAAALAAAKDNDVIFIDEGLYPDQEAVISQNNLKIIGLGTAPRITAPQVIKNRKAIWVIDGDNVILRNLELSGARVPDRNGAAIRQQGRHLTLEQLKVHDNEMGILTNNVKEAELVIRDSEIFNNAQDYYRTGKLSHNVYVGAIASFLLEDSVIYGALTGHNVKSRARKNILRQNIISDTDEHAASYLIDFPNGGEALVENCTLIKKKASENNALISFGAENKKQDGNSLTIRNVVARAEGSGRILLRNHSLMDPELQNNQLENISGESDRDVEVSDFFDNLLYKIRKWLQ
ncbi:right-handed parallel beta-helix repeat-containing protein [Emcibacter nanhaiensis]|uniref:right-handed parallel beta-helix repeat-containing protein n=1 Tax=Emcibacter nanhaiensis TaxID=1505037 RepID=UPI0015E41EF1|nr:right-handed parallel beta-helix repeat-containing protein [Emcibacter nanhaiensis]